MSACLMVGAVAVQLASGRFSLEWLHSVEKTGWRETWVVEGSGLRLIAAAVMGSGAGMEPGEGAVLQDGWWVWHPDGPVVPELELAASGATVSGWTFCADGRCEVLGAEPGAPVRLAPCGG